MSKMLGVVALLAAAGVAQGAVVYSAIPGPYAAFAAAPGGIGFDDYASTETGYFELQSMRFVGSSDTAGGTVRIEFYTFDPNPALAVFHSSITVGLPVSAGTIYGLTFAPGFWVPNNGYIQMVATGTNARWFLSTTAPSVGTQSYAVGSSNPTALISHRFELTSVPAPGALALLGLGGLVAGRRRR